MSFWKKLKKRPQEGAPKVRIFDLRSESVRQIEKDAFSGKVAADVEASAQQLMQLWRGHATGNGGFDFCLGKTDTGQLLCFACKKPAEVSDGVLSCSRCRDAPWPITLADYDCDCEGTYNEYKLKAVVAVGRMLHQQGGIEAMQKVAYRCVALCGGGGQLISELSSAWDGIGDWYA